MKTNREILAKFISTEGYKRNSPDKNRPFNIIPSGNITMQDVDFPVKGVDNLGNEMMMMPGEEYTFPGDYVVETPMAQAGGTKPSFNFQSKPTRADSLDLYNRALNIDKYYNNLKNKGWYKNVEITPTDGLTSEGLKKQMEYVDKRSRDTYKHQANSYYNPMKDMYPTADPKKYNKLALAEHDALTKGTRYATKDNAPSIIDPMAPTTVVDTRIIPKETVTYYDRKTSAEEDYYKSIKKPSSSNLTPAQQIELDNILKKTPGKTPAGGALTMLYRYDPLSIKPWDLLTDSERELRVKKYGRDGVPDSYKPLKAKTKSTTLKTSKPTAPVNNTTSTETPVVTKVESTPAPKVERKVVSITPEQVKPGFKTTSGKQIGSGTAGGRIYRVKYDNGETEILNEFEYRSRGLKMQAGGQFDFVRNQSPNPTTNFEKRMYNNTNKIQNEDGSYSTHKMLSWSDDNGFYVAPTIVEINGKLKELSENEAIEHAYKTGELKSFKSGQEAQEYANNGYKKGTPIEFLEGGQTGWLDNYQEGGQRMYPAPSLEFQKRVQDNIRRNQVQPTFVRREPVTVSQTDNTRTNAVENAKRDLESYTQQERAYFAQNNIPRDQWFSAKAKMQNDAVLKRREEVKRQAQADVRNNPFAITPATNEQLRNEFRAFPNDPDSFFDEYLNPAQMIGNLAASIGDNFTGEGPIDPWRLATDIVTPAFVGMTAGIGAQNTGQFANNLINPLAGVRNPFSRRSSNLETITERMTPSALYPEGTPLNEFGRPITSPDELDRLNRMNQRIQERASLRERMQQLATQRAPVMNIDEIRSAYHNSERFLSSEEMQLLRDYGRGNPSKYIDNDYLNSVDNSEQWWKIHDRNSQSLSSQQLPPPPSEIQFMPDGTTKTIYNRQPLVQDTFNLNKLKKPINKSGLTKEQVIEKASSKDKDAIFKMSETEFENTVLKPDGQLAEYRADPFVEQMMFDRSTGRNVLKDQTVLTEQEYVDAFNSNLDLLNDIIKRRNKSGVEYRVKGLNPNGTLQFETPPQSIPSNISPKAQQRIDRFYSNPEEFLKKEAGLFQEGNVWRFPDEVGGDTFNSVEEAVQFTRKELEDIAAPTTISGESTWGVRLNPGKWKGNVEDLPNTEYLRSIPGIEMSNTTAGVFSDRVARKGTGAYESINEYLKALDLGRVKPGFNSQTDYSRGAWENFIKSGRGVGFYANPRTVYGSMKTLAPIGVGIGAGAALKTKEKGGQTGWLDKYK